jgi:hypothetical protein
MNVMKKLPVLILLASSLLTFACVYVVLPEGLEAPATTQEVEQRVWSAVITNVGTSASGDLHIDITIRNDTGEWSTMQAIPDKPAVLKTGDGKRVNCDTVFIGTGGHRFAPGFQLRGYTTGAMDSPETQTLYVECKGATTSPGSTLSIYYESFNGVLDVYHPEENGTEGILQLSLDEVVTDLTYPVATPADGEIQKVGANITGLSDNVVTLLDAQRTDTGFQFTWQNFNPTKFPLKTHIGTPPVIGSDGMIYGPYESLDIAEIPITPANDKVSWVTDVIVPKDVNGLYILLSVESKKPRTYLNYLLDISDK